MGQGQDGLGLTEEERAAAAAELAAGRTSTSTSSYSGYYAPKGTIIYTPGVPTDQQRTALYEITPQSVYNIRYNDKWTKNQENLIKSILVAGRYMKADENIPNIWNESATRGFLNLLGDANNNGLTYNDMFRVIMASPEDTAANRSSTTRTFTISDPATARKLVNTTINSVLGRDATREELAKFASALKTYERGAPSVTTTTGGAGSTTVTSNIGASAAGREEAILGAMSKRQTKEFRGVVDTQLGELFTNLLEEA